MEGLIRESNLKKNGGENSEYMVEVFVYFHRSLMGDNIFHSNLGAYCLVNSKMKGGL